MAGPEGTMDTEPGTPPERYLDLHLEIRAKTRRTYVVTARSSLGHQGSADARLPEEFAAGGTGSLLAEAPERVRALGTALFESIISGDVRSVFDRI
jgi:hypothetical protein